MPNWSEPMQQTFEYYVVDPTTWADIKQIDSVKSCTITRDSSVETLGSASIELTESVGECYIRVYLITIQNGLTEKHPLGTFLVQTPSTSFDGKITSISVDAYTPLMELKENPTPLGYSVRKNTNIMDMAYRLTRENCRAPVVEPKSDETLYADFVSNVDDTWLSFNRDLMANAKFSYGLDERGRIIFNPDQEVAALQPLYTYDDGNSSILYPELSLNHDLYNIPNVVEVVYSSGHSYYTGRAVNDDENSPISTVNRGRLITYRDSNPSVIGNPTEEYIQQYAEQLLRNLSSLEYTLSYSHGYTPVRIGDCVRLQYSRAELNNVKAKVISQTIECKPGCKVTEKAVFTTKLWR